MEMKKYRVKNGQMFRGARFDPQSQTATPYTAKAGEVIEFPATEDVLTAFGDKLELVGASKPADIKAGGSPLESLKVPELRALAQHEGFDGVSGLLKAQLVDELQETYGEFTEEELQAALAALDEG